MLSLFFLFFFCFFFNDTATTEIYTLSLHDALPIGGPWPAAMVVDRLGACPCVRGGSGLADRVQRPGRPAVCSGARCPAGGGGIRRGRPGGAVDTPRQPDGPADGADRVPAADRFAGRRGRAG